MGFAGSFGSLELLFKAFLNSRSSYFYSDSNVWDAKIQFSYYSHSILCMTPM